MARVPVVHENGPIRVATIERSMKARLAFVEQLGAHRVFAYGFTMVTISRAVGTATLVALASGAAGCFNYYGRLPPEVVQKTVREHYHAFGSLTKTDFAPTPNYKVVSPFDSSSNEMVR